MGKRVDLTVFEDWIHLVSSGRKGWEVGRRLSPSASRRNSWTSVFLVCRMSIGSVCWSSKLARFIGFSCGHWQSNLSASELQCRSSACLTRCVVWRVSQLGVPARCDWRKEYRPDSRCTSLSRWQICCYFIISQFIKEAQCWYKM